MEFFLRAGEINFFQLTARKVLMDIENHCLKRSGGVLIS
jgi:hypothetical protein